MAIDPKLFTVERLLAVLFDDMAGNVNVWRQTATIILAYMPPYPTKDTRPRCVVECNGSFLRHSAGPRQRHFWDLYGDDYISPELALVGLLEAPIPPSLIKAEAWEERNRQGEGTSK